MSCTSAAKRSACIRVSSSASGSSSTARRRGASEPKTSSRPALERELLAQHLERVAVDVEVVEVALLDAAQARRARAARPPSRPRRSASARPSSTRSAITSRRSSAQIALGRGLGDAARVLARQPLGLRVGRERELGREPHEPQRAQRVVAVGLLAEHAQDARLEVARAPPCGSSSSGVSSAHRHRVRAEVALGEVVLDRAALQRRDVADEARSPRSRATRRTPPTAGTPGPPAADATARATASRVAGVDEVDVGDRAPEDRVAHRAAHHPDRAAPARRAPRARAAPGSDSWSRWATSLTGARGRAGRAATARR